MRTEGQRYNLIDAVRGAAIVNMVVFHFLYDVFIIYGLDPLWYARPLVHVWQQAICRTFICVSGFVWRWGERGSLRRGLLLNLCGGLISLVTCAAIPSQAVWFGILTFMGCAALLLRALHGCLRRVRPGWGAAVCAALFAVFFGVPDGFLGVGGLALVRLPEWLYTIKILTPLGLPYPGFTSGDYFPLLPWIFLYLFGYFLSGAFAGRARLEKAALRRVPALSAIGRASLWIYLLHQPVSMLVCALIFR